MKHVLRPLMTSLFVALSFAALSGCSSAEKKPTPDELPQAPEPTIDYEALQRDLGVTDPPDQVGYRDKQFDACQLGPALPQLRDCKKAYFVLIEFQLQCRSTEDPSGGMVNAADLEPIINQRVTWRLGGLSGAVITDSQGYGQIRTLASASMKKTKLRLQVGQDFLYITAKDSTNIVTPVSWCH